jgi:hypothetical protein
MVAWPSSSWSMCHPYCGAIWSVARIPEAEVGRLKELVSLAEAAGVALRKTGQA